MKGPKMEKINVKKPYELLTSGKTYKEIGDEFGVSKQAVHQWRKYFFPNLSREEFGASKRMRLKSAGKVRKYVKHTSDVSRAQSEFLTRKRQNRGKWEFTITMDDVIWNDVCPILGIKIDWFATKRSENSPSLDRIDPSKGYIPGNVQLISWRANRIKNDGTAQEHRQIADYMTSLSLQVK